MWFLIIPECFVLLQRLGERWTAVCRWTEDRRVKLQEIQLLWQELLEEQVSSCPVS